MTQTKALALDLALGEWTKARLMKARGTTFFGFSFTSDESPPSSNQYKGLRFQITYVYWLTYACEDEWDDQRYATKYPFTREKQLCDSVHCPSKKGADVLQLLEHQWQAKGLVRLEACGGSGDGGGENEGISV